ncbi:MAG: hypothetical protein GY805_11155 [Chloroflexi bacterium]|nr:hypothetical protein [Chloroflexota bacterium]
MSAGITEDNIPFLERLLDSGDEVMDIQLVESDIDHDSELPTEELEE